MEMPMIKISKDSCKRVTPLSIGTKNYAIYRDELLRTPHHLQWDVVDDVAELSFVSEILGIHVVPTSNLCFTLVVHARCTPS